MIAYISILCGWLDWSQTDTRSQTIKPIMSFQNTKSLKLIILITYVYAIEVMNRAVFPLKTIQSQQISTESERGAWKLCRTLHWFHCVKFIYSSTLQTFANISVFILASLRIMHINSSRVRSFTCWEVHINTHSRTLACSHTKFTIPIFSVEFGTYALIIAAEPYGFLGQIPM